MLPESGVAGFGQFLETTLVGSLALLDGALPAQYGLRTGGIIDITTRSGAFDGGGAATPAAAAALHAAGRIWRQFDGWNYFVTGLYLANRQGIENPAADIQS